MLVKLLPAPNPVALEAVVVTGMNPVGVVVALDISTEKVGVLSVVAPLRGDSTAELNAGDEEVVIDASRRAQGASWLLSAWAGIEAEKM
jgi:hypothetical protein